MSRLILSIMLALLCTANCWAVIVIDDFNDAGGVILGPPLSITVIDEPITGSGFDTTRDGYSPPSVPNPGPAAQTTGGVFRIGSNNDNDRFFLQYDGTDGLAGGPLSHTILAPIDLASGTKFSVDFVSGLLPDNGATWQISVIDDNGNSGLSAEQVYGFGTNDMLFADIVGTQDWSIITGIELRLKARDSGAGPFDFDNFVTDASPAAVPEPSSYALMALGLAGLAALRRRRP